MPSNTLDVPADVALCPYCASPLYLEVDEWDEDNTPTETGSHVWCTNANTDEEVERHTYMPYVYWLPVDRRVYRMFASRCRVEDDTLLPPAPPELTPAEEMRRAGAAPLPGF
jgi:hypothetical protein